MLNSAAEASSAPCPVRATNRSEPVYVQPFSNFMVPVPLRWPFSLSWPVYCPSEKSFCCAAIWNYFARAPKFAQMSLLEFATRRSTSGSDSQPQPPAEAHLRDHRRVGVGGVWGRGRRAGQIRQQGWPPLRRRCRARHRNSCIDSPKSRRRHTASAWAGRRGRRRFEISLCSARSRTASQDFGDGGAYPECHLAQFPLNLGKKNPVWRAAVHLLRPTAARSSRRPSCR